MPHNKAHPGTACRIHQQQGQCHPHVLISLGIGNMKKLDTNNKDFLGMRKSDDLLGTKSQQIAPKDG